MILAETRMKVLDPTWDSSLISLLLCPKKSVESGGPLPAVVILSSKPAIFILMSMPHPNFLNLEGPKA